jgi:hypothetical protein
MVRWLLPRLSTNYGGNTPDAERGEQHEDDQRP